MSTKEQVLKLLSDKKGQVLSGEELAVGLGVSRNAIWKAITSLREEGYDIVAAKRSGYMLAPDTDMLTLEGVKAALTVDVDVEVYKEITSTNTVLKDRANEGAADGLVLVAGHQTAGRGRIGRKFHSPSDTGVYLSILLRPTELEPEECIKVTTLAAVAACEAIGKVAGRQASIKWVNDIFIDGRKTCGILTEASMSIENGKLDHVIVGIGFNAYEPKDGFPEEIKDIAGAIFKERTPDAKNHLAAEFINSFMSAYRGGLLDDYVEKYKARSFVIGMDVNVISPLETRPGRAIDIDDKCRLVVEFEDGHIEHVSTGEISVRLR